MVAISKTFFTGNPPQVTFGVNPKRALEVLEKNGIRLFAKENMGGRYNVQFEAVGLSPKQTSIYTNGYLHKLYPRVTFIKPGKKPVAAPLNNKETPESAITSFLQELPRGTIFSVDLKPLRFLDDFQLARAAEDIQPEHIKSVTLDFD